jgi:hypothetical protein
MKGPSGLAAAGKCPDYASLSLGLPVQGRTRTRPIVWVGLDEPIPRVAPLPSDHGAQRACSHAHNRMKL